MFWRNIWNSRQIAANIKEKLAHQEKVPSSRNNFTFPYFATELSTVGFVISEQHSKCTLYLTKIVNNYGLKWGTVWRIVRFFSHFSRELYLQFWKYFHSMVLGSEGRDYCKNNRVLEFLAETFLIGCFSSFK